MLLFEKLIIYFFLTLSNPALADIPKEFEIPVGQGFRQVLPSHLQDDKIKAWINRIAVGNCRSWYSQNLAEAQKCIDVKSHKYELEEKELDACHGKKKFFSFTQITCIDQCGLEMPFLDQVNAANKKIQMMNIQPEACALPSSPQEQQRMMELQKEQMAALSQQFENALKYVQGIFKNPPFEMMKLTSQTANQMKLSLSNVPSGKEKLQAKAKKLVQQLDDLEKSAFKKIHPYDRVKDEEINRILANAKSNKLTQEQISYILKAKRDWLDLLDQEGSILQLSSYSEKQDHPGIKVLQKISKIQNKQLDIALTDSLITQYLAAQNQAKTKPFKVLIQGAGPMGLLLAFHQMRSGADVHVIEARSEQYSRDQIPMLNSTLLAELSYLLGTKFDDLFINSSIGNLTCLETFETGSLPIKHLEDALKVRLVELLSRAEVKLKKNPIRLDYLLAMDSIQETPLGLVPKLIPKERKNSTENPREKIPDEHYDLVVFAGGAHDQMKERYMAPSVKRTTTAYTGNFVFNKKNGRKKPATTDAAPNLFDPALGQISVPAAKMIETLITPRFQDWINQQLILPEAFKKKYSDLKEYFKKEEPTLLTQVDGEERLVISLSAPSLMKKFILDLDSIIYSTKDNQKVKDFKQELVDRWLNALLKHVVNDEKELSNLTLDREHSTFYSIAVATPRKTVKMLPSRSGQPVILTVVGDSNAAPDSRTGTGLETGRGSILNVSAATRKLIQDGDLASFRINLQNHLRKTQDRAVNLSLGVPGTQALNQAEQVEENIKQTAQVLDRYLDGFPTDSRKFKLSKVSGTRPEYWITFQEGARTIHRPLRINKDGTLSLKRGNVMITGDTLEDLLFHQGVR